MTPPVPSRFRFHNVDRSWVLKRDFILFCLHGKSKNRDMFSWDVRDHFNWHLLRPLPLLSSPPSLPFFPLPYLTSLVPFSIPSHRQTRILINTKHISTCSFAQKQRKQKQHFQSHLPSRKFLEISSCLRYPFWKLMTKRSPAR